VARRVASRVRSGMLGGGMSLRLRKTVKAVVADLDSAAEGDFRFGRILSLPREKARASCNGAFTFE
ncbi:MAG TPA: hypothetical protein VMZ06_02205, partial [Candidatus Bathyarchaeia archaeon]|nr:hypothetical protein [Candidatus Bathyarchaeia archaeon]